MGKTSKKREMPGVYKMYMGRDIAARRGHTVEEEWKVVSFDSVSLCLGDDCLAVSLCPYEKIGKCTVQLKFIQNTIKTIWSVYGMDLGQSQLYRIGTQLLPLYGILCKIWITEVGIKHVLEKRGSKGVFIHPIYKELRETIKTIDSLWKSLGLDDIGLGKSALKKDLRYVKKGRGDPNYHKMISGIK